MPSVESPRATAALRQPRSAREKLALAIEVLLMYVKVRWRLRGDDLRATVSELRACGSGVDSELVGFEAQIEGVRLGRAVSRTLRLLPTDSRCLMRSLVLTALLAKRGMQSSLVLGVCSSPDFAAHAWVEQNGAPVISPGGPQFNRLLEI